MGCGSNWIEDRRSVWPSVKFQFQNLERRSVKDPKFGTSIRIDVKIPTFLHALLERDSEPVRERAEKGGN